jgi:NodT family efflux transporter outer membrane factor (OMF) lipoprotein
MSSTPPIESVWSSVMKSLSIGLISLLLVFVSACSVGPKYKAPAMPAPPAWKEADSQTYKEAGNWKPAQPADTKIRGKWWEMFSDGDLNRLEEQIDGSNQDLKVAQSHFDQARALIRLNRSNYFPTVSVGAGATANRLSSNAVLTNQAAASGYGDFVLPVDFSWEADVWGRIRHEVEAAREEAQASAADLEAVRLSLHSELAFDYFELRSLDAQQKLLDDTVVAWRQALELTQRRFEGGASSGVEVAQAQTELDQTVAQDQDIGVQRAAYEHAIAVLIGKPPAEFALGPKPLNAEPPQIPIGVPSQLLERRPDIAAAERRVAEANAEVGIARSAYYPTVVLSAAVGLEGNSIANWFAWPSRFWAAGPEALETLFDAGRRHATNDAALAAWNGTVATYRQTSLDAFQQVEDNLAALRILAQESETQRAAVAAAQHSLDLSMNRYTGGLVTYLEVVTAQSTALANERTAVDIQRRRMDASVLLIKALGGGWDTSQLPALKKG